MSNIVLKLVNKKVLDYACKYFHYSKCSPASKYYALGCYENNNFIGVISYGRGANNNACKFYNLKSNEICELTRIAFKKHITPVSKFLSISLKLLKKDNPNLKLCFSYADKDMNHHGGIYQATNWQYLGSNFGKSDKIIINGKKTHRKTITAIFNRRGIKSSIDNVRKYLDPNAEIFKSSGKHLYIYILDKSYKLDKKTYKYPKRA